MLLTCFFVGQTLMASFDDGITVHTIDYVNKYPDYHLLIYGGGDHQYTLSVPETDPMYAMNGQEIMMDCYNQAVFMDTVDDGEYYMTEG